MFNLDEKYFMKPCDEDKPCPPRTPNPRYTMTEEMNATMIEMRATIDRLLRFEKRVEEMATELMRKITSDNVIFKNTFSEAYNTFLRDVRNEINVFEGNMENSNLLFTKDIEARFATVVDDNNRANAENYNNFVAKLNEAIDYMKTNISQYLEGLIDEMYDEGDFAEIIEGVVFTNFQTRTSMLKGNVKLYGAKGDGIADDTVAIQSAIAENNIVYFPAGKYNVNSTLIIPKSPEDESGARKTILVGEHKQSIIYYNGGGNVIENNGDLVIRDLWVEGNGTNKNGLYNSGSIKLYNSQFNNNGENGLMFNEGVHCVHPIIEGCTFYKNLKNGIHCVTNTEWQNTSVRILNCYCSGNGSMNDGVAQTNGHGNGILLGACLGVSVMNTVCEYNHGAGILVRNEGAYGIFNVTIIANYFEGNRYANIYLNNADKTLAYKEIFIESNYYSYYPATPDKFYTGSLMFDSVKTVIKNADCIIDSIIDETIYNNKYMTKESRVVYLEHGNVDAKSFKSLTVTIDNLDKSKGLHVTPIGQIPYGIFFYASYTSNPDEIRIDAFNLGTAQTYVASHGFLIESTK